MALCLTSKSGMYELAADAAFAYDTANRLLHTRTTKSDQAKLEDTR